MYLELLRKKILNIIEVLVILEFKDQVKLLYMIQLILLELLEGTL